jgi:hypothetical protein
MKQSVLASWIETIASTATGFLISLALQYLVCWYYGLELKLHDNLAIIALFTVASLARGFLWRRLMERFHVRRKLSPFMQAVVAERFRQMEQEGWSTEHDDEHRHGDLARAGACYLLEFALRKDDTQLARDLRPMIGRLWPWHREWWKPRKEEPRRDVVRGVALAIAEGEKFDRLKTKRRAS